jgi:hypothetical protein
MNNILLTIGFLLFYLILPLAIIVSGINLWIKFRRNNRRRHNGTTLPRHA